MMNILTTLLWIKNHWKTAIKGVLVASVASLLFWSVSTYNKNIKLSHQLETAQNNIEAYQGLLDSSQQANNVLRLDLSKLSEQNDSLLQELDKVRREKKIKGQQINTAATQTQVVYVNNSREVKGDILTILRDTIYTDTLKYNDLTKIYYSIGKDSVNMTLDLQNTQYLFVYKTREYKNKKNFIKRLFTLDFKKVDKYRYEIVNTNDLLKEDNVRVIENYK